MKRKQDQMLIVMCWVLYVSAYLGRYSYNTNLLPLSLYYGQPQDQVALATTFFFFAYGAGQIVNGILCKYFNTKYVLSIAVMISAAINLSVFMGIPFVYIKYLWLINGIVQSVLWAGMMRALSAHVSKESIGKAIVAMSTTSGAGTLLSYGLSSLLAIWNGFRYSFLISAICMSVTSVLWILCYDRMTRGELQEPEPEAQTGEQKKAKTGKSRGGLVPTLVLFGAVAVIINLVKDGLFSWVPTILYEKYTLAPSLSIFVTLLLPVLGLFGTAFVINLHKKIERHTLLMSVMFGLSAILVAAVTGLFATPYWYLVLAAFALLALLMSGANNIVNSMMPLELRDRGNSGLIAGILNGCCYVGSTFSQYGLALIAQNYGWDAMFYMFLVACAAVVAACMVAFLIERFFRKKRAKEIA